MWSDWKWVKNPNTPPYGGWLSISNGNPDSPFEGYGMTSSFTLGTDDWEDDYTPDRKRIFTFFFKSMLNYYRSPLLSDGKKKQLKKILFPIEKERPMV